MSLTSALLSLNFVAKLYPMANSCTTVKESKTIIWFNRLVRWGLGSFFIIAGIVNFDKGAWPAILFGGLIFITGFFKPRNCIQGGCSLR